MSLQYVKAKLAAAQDCTDNKDWGNAHIFEDKAMLASLELVAEQHPDAMEATKLVLAWHREHPNNARRSA